MRPPIAAELVLFARALMVCPAGVRARRAKEILAETETAHDHLRHFGKIHPTFGDGSLTARLLSLSPGAEPFADDADFLQSLSTVVESLLFHLDR